MIALFTPLAIALSSFVFSVELSTSWSFSRAKTPDPIATIQI